MNTDAVTQQKNWNGKPYHSLDHMLRERFGEKVYKVTLNGGMSCPNRMVSLAARGCISAVPVEAEILLQMQSCR